MSIRINKSYQLAIPFDVERRIRKLLNKIPKDHLNGLGSILLVDHVSQKQDREAGGLYWQKTGQELAKIEIAIDQIYRGMPSFVFFLPFITKFMLAAVLYHEIGHHLGHSIHGIAKRESESFAEKYKHKMLNKAFFWWRLFLFPMEYLARWLIRSLQRNKLKRT